MRSLLCHIPYIKIIPKSYVFSKAIIWISSYQWREWLPVGVRDLKNVSWLSFLSSLDVSATWKPGLPFFVKGFPAYWDHSMLNPFVRKSTCFVYLLSSLFVQSSSSRQRWSLESNEDCLANIYGTCVLSLFAKQYEWSRIEREDDLRERIRHT